MKEEISVPAIIYGMRHSSLFPMHTELTYKGLHHLTPSLLLSYNCKSNEVVSLKRMPQVEEVGCYDFGYSCKGLSLPDLSLNAPIAAPWLFGCLHWSLIHYPDACVFQTRHKELQLVISIFQSQSCCLGFDPWKETSFDVVGIFLKISRYMNWSLQNRQRHLQIKQN